MKTYRIAGINFDHFHMGDLLREAFEHPQAKIVGISDELPERLVNATRKFGLSADQVFTDYRACLEKTKPDIVLLCPAASRHGEWVEKVAPFGPHLIIEKPYAGSLTEADAMAAAMKPTGSVLAVNWPLVWNAGQQTARRLIADGVIGELREYHYYGGNRGPLYHGADKVERTTEPTAADKASSWFYSRADGGGSMLDYMGYGATLGTWHMGGRKPIEVTAAVDQPEGLEVDEHSISILRYDTGLSKTETCWGTFTDPWTYPPQPRCGFVFKGSDGTISCMDYEPALRIQTRQKPEGYDLRSAELRAPYRNSIENLIAHFESEAPLIGPLTLEISRIGQQIVDTAALSAQEKRAVHLLG